MQGVGGDSWRPDLRDDGTYTLISVLNDSNVNLINTIIKDTADHRFTLGTVAAGTTNMLNLQVVLSSSKDFQISFDDLGAGTAGTLYLCFVQ